MAGGSLPNNGGKIQEECCTDFPMGEFIHQILPTPTASSIQNQRFLPLESAKTLFRNRRLIWELARRELVDPHAGQIGGYFWLLLHPITFFTIYALLFAVVFKIRINGSGPEDYLVYLFAGLAPWQLVQDSLVRGANCMLANASVVKKVMFPSEVMLAKTLLSTIIVHVPLILLVTGYGLVFRGLALTNLFVPLLIVIQILLIWGLGSIFASLTPYFRDFTEFIRIFSTANVYMMPIMYTEEMVPPPLQIIVHLNPFSHLIYCWHDLLYHQTIAHPGSWLFLLLFTAAATVTGTHLFSRLKPHFASVI